MQIIYKNMQKYKNVKDIQKYFYFWLRKYTKMYKKYSIGIQKYAKNIQKYIRKYIKIYKNIY